MTDDPTAILDLADKAVRCVMRRGQWSWEEWKDATQEAALAIVAHGPAHEGTLFLVAKHAIIDWLRSWLRTPRGAALFDWRDYKQGDGPDPAWDRRYLAELAPMLDAQRAEKSAEDIRYLELLLAGYSSDGIALELGISRRNVYAIRERLLPRLERLARGEAAMYRANVQASSLAALERINRDPAMLARRAEAIRAGWARRKAARQGAAYAQS